MSWWRRSPAVRETGPPRSSNGASSMHLWWQLPGRFVEVSATVEVVEPPAVEALHFWALQASFADGARRWGGAHLGLQAHPRHPGGTAVNWGGYRAAEDGGGELDGTASALPSALGNANTRDFPWTARRPYRLRIARGNRGWLGEVVDLSTGKVTTVRELLAPGRWLERPVVWSEVFADCGAPPTAVRWSALEAVDDEGRRHEPSGLVASYQAFEDGGCTNTTSEVTGPGEVVQRTATTRTTPAGGVLQP